jgi:hypothetical protein
MSPSACSFIACWFPPSFTTCFGLRGHLQVCRIFFIFMCSKDPASLLSFHSARSHPFRSCTAFLRVFCLLFIVVVCPFRICPHTTLVNWLYPLLSLPPLGQSEAITSTPNFKKIEIRREAGETLSHTDITTISPMQGKEDRATPSAKAVRARVQAPVRSHGICGGQSGTGPVSSQYFGFPRHVSLHRPHHTHLQPSSRVAEV